MWNISRKLPTCTPKNVHKMLTKLSNNAPKLTKKRSKMVPGPPWGATVKIFAFCVASHHPFCGFRLPFGGPGAHIFDHFLMWLLVVFWSTIWRRFLRNLAPIWARFWYHFGHFFGTPRKSENLTPAAAGTLFWRIQGDQNHHFFGLVSRTRFGSYFWPTFYGFGSPLGILVAPLGHFISIIFCHTFLGSLFKHFFVTFGLQMGRGAPLS